MKLFISVIKIVQRTILVKRFHQRRPSLQKVWTPHPNSNRYNNKKIIITNDLNIFYVKSL